MGCVQVQTVGRKGPNGKTLTWNTWVDPLSAHVFEKSVFYAHVDNSGKLLANQLGGFKAETVYN